MKLLLRARALDGRRGLVRRRLDTLRFVRLRQLFDNVRAAARIKRLRLGHEFTVGLARRQPTLVAHHGARAVFALACAHRRGSLVDNAARLS